MAGQFPKFEDEVYKIANPTSADSKFLLPTAETALVNLHRDEILSLEELPRKYIAYTPCYRREAGSYRSEERGMIRGHQFNKVEMVQYTTEDGSDAAFEELVGKAERLVQGLGLHYRLSKLAAGDCSASMARTYDIEVWIPSMGIYKEVSSASNARAYQARPGQHPLPRGGRQVAPVPYPQCLRPGHQPGVPRAGGAVSERRRLRDGAGSAAALPRGGCDPLKKRTAAENHGPIR